MFTVVSATLSTRKRGSRSRSTSRSVQVGHVEHPSHQPLTDLAGPFRGSTAVAAGLLTRGQLRGPRFRRLFPDVYAPAALEVDLALRARAAGLLVAGRGAVAGYAAAELWGASCAPSDEPAHVLMTDRYRSDGLRVHRDYFDFDETVPIDSGGVHDSGAHGVRPRSLGAASSSSASSPSMPSRICGADLDAVRTLRHRYLGSHGGADIAEALRLSDRRSESPMETRVRMPLVLAGLRPEVQYPVVVNGRRYRLDLAFPELLIAVEYDGAEHRPQARARRDLVREAELTARDGGSSGSTLMS